MRLFIIALAIAFAPACKSTQPDTAQIKDLQVGTQALGNIPSIWYANSGYAIQTLESLVDLGNKVEIRHMREEQSSTLPFSWLSHQRGLVLDANATVWSRRLRRGALRTPVDDFCLH